MKMILAVFLLGISMFADGERCPSDEELYPCTCTYYDRILVKCEDNYTMTLNELQQSLKVLHGQTKVEISLNYFKLGKVPSNFFKGIGIRKLDIFHCAMDSLGDGNEPILSGLENSLEVLEIHGSIKANTDLTHFKLGHLRKLNEFLLAYNSIKEVSDSWFDKGSASVEFVFLYNNGIEQLADTAFADLANLRLLALTGNSLTNIKRSMLPSSADSFRHINLNNNTLTYLPEDVFSDMPQLSSIFIRSNRFARLDQETWESVWEQLKEAEFEGNPLVCDSRMNWMFELRSPTIVGTCDSPKAKNGTSIQDFINNKGQ